MSRLAGQTGGFAVLLLETAEGALIARKKACLGIRDLLGSRVADRTRTCARIAVLVMLARNTVVGIVMLVGSAAGIVEICVLGAR